MGQRENTFSTNKIAKIINNKIGRFFLVNLMRKLEVAEEKISKKSVKLVDNNTSPQIVLQDDGYGNLYDVSFSSSYSNRTPDSNNSGSVVGNIFYDDGLMVITDTGSYSSVGDGNFNLTFDSTQTIYEREYVCRINEDDFLEMRCMFYK